MKITTDMPLPRTWTAIDSNTYDWAPDGRNAPIGFGETERDAINDLVEQLVNAAYERGYDEAVAAQSAQLGQKE